MTEKVLITGGAGYLGRGILRRRALSLPDWDVTIYSRDEMKQDECRRRYPDVRYVLGDVRDLDHLQQVMTGHDLVIHAAAVKYIDSAELNATECVNVNVGGSQMVARAAWRADVRRVVGISTDKSACPVNVYGASKMIMERLFAESSTPSTAFTCVRYGNVVGSTGSVIPLFQRQYAEAGRVRITNPKMTRFWMGVDQAIDLILTALTEARAGAVVIPYAEAMSLVDVARAATVDDVPVDVIGERPGEKVAELLLHHEESVRVSRHEGWIELLPPGTPSDPNVVENPEPFTIASHSPHHWMDVATMRELIADAASV